MTIFVYEYATAQGEQFCSPSLLAEGRAMRDAIVGDFRQIPSVAVEMLAGVDDPESFRSLASRCDASLIIAPEFDGILESSCREVVQAGGRLLGPSPEAVALTADKWALFKHFENYKIATPSTWKSSEAPGQYPQVWKPRFGAGSQSIFRIDSESAIPAALRIVQEEGASEMIVQPLLEGTPASVAFLLGPSESIALLPCYQNLSTDGRFRYQGGGCPIESDLWDRAIRIARSALNYIPGLLGYVGVDILLGSSEAGDSVIEVNPRLTTSYVGMRRLARFNIAEAMVSIALGEKVPGIRWKEGRVQFEPNGIITSIPSPS